MIHIDDLTAALDTLCRHATVSGDSRDHAAAQLVAAATPAVVAAISATWALRHHGHWTHSDYPGWWSVSVQVLDPTVNDCNQVIATFQQPALQP